MEKSELKLLISILIHIYLSLILVALHLTFYIIYIKDLIFTREDLQLSSDCLISEKRIKRICWIFNKNVTYQVLVSFCSIIKNNPNEKFAFYFILPPNTTIDMRAFDHFLKPWMSIEIRHYSMNHLSTTVDFEKKKCPHSPIIFVKICLPEILPEVNQILYLDADMVNNGRISDIWNYNCKGMTILATRRVKRWWINSGFVFYNLDEIRKKKKKNDGMRKK